MARRRDRRGIPYIDDMIAWLSSCVNQKRLQYIHKFGLKGAVARLKCPSILMMMMRTSVVLTMSMPERHALRTKIWKEIHQTSFFFR